MIYESWFFDIRICSSRIEKLTLTIIYFQMVARKGKVRTNKKGRVQFIMKKKYSHVISALRYTMVGKTFILTLRVPKTLATRL